jgi:hypothetical protein
MRNNEGKWQDSLNLETVFHEGSSPSTRSQYRRIFLSSLPD